VSHWAQKEFDDSDRLGAGDRPWDRESTPDCLERGFRPDPTVRQAGQRMIALRCTPTTHSTLHDQVLTCPSMVRFTSFTRVNRRECSAGNWGDPDQSQLLQASAEFVYTFRTGTSSDFHLPPIASRLHAPISSTFLMDAPSRTPKPSDLPSVGPMPAPHTPAPAGCIRRCIDSSDLTS
jgi:hypothetical protein